VWCSLANDVESIARHTAGGQKYAASDSGGVFMKKVSQLQPMVLAVSGALALMAASGYAQTFDPNSAAVRQAYVGAATQEKKDAALAGLTLLARQIPGPCPFSLCSQGGGVIIRLTPDQPFNFGPPWPQINSTTLAANNGDLGAAGAPVTLNNTLLRTLASFSTPRDFAIGTGGARIDTNGFNLSITGTLTANGVLVKDGQGTLTVTGNNVWNQQPYVANGVLEGNTTSLQTSILNNGTVRFNQAADGTYTGVISKAEPSSGISFIVTTDPFGNPTSPAQAPTPNPFGNFEKTGSGKLTLNNAQAYGGTTTILGGTLALQGGGSLGNTSALNIGNGATFDISASGISFHSGVGQLSGAGKIVLGDNTLRVDSNNDSTFSGLISGSGAFIKGGTGTLTFTGANDARSTFFVGGTLSLVGSTIEFVDDTRQREA
jgi:autotransporter-associated beta strand protein